MWAACCWDFRDDLVENIFIDLRENVFGRIRMVIRL
jgi:hypothetical protein